ncbi:MAG: hypothetical protein NT081_06970 [Actinobacteria bacterium]|nr:hypothetical protein [Actinomycetota bacterium]
MSATKAKPTIVGRLAYLPKPDGPHARLGVLWFIAACAACALGTIAVAVLFSVLAAVAAMQTVRAWTDVGRRSNPIVGGVAAAVVPIAALAGPKGFAAGFIVAMAIVVVSGVLRSNVLVGLRSAILPGFAAGSVVLTGRTDMGALVVLLILIGAYETGDYLMGAEAESIFEGPLSGIAAVMVVTFAESVFQIGPFETRAGWVFGTLVAVLAPLGALLASVLGPTSESAGPALRRLDAWLIVAPVWCWMLTNYLARSG